MFDPATAQALLKDNFAPWVQALQPRVTEITPLGAVIEMPITPDIARIGGIVCGQALMTLADTTMVFACAGHLDAFVPVATTNLETRFLSAARGKAIRAEARVIKAGRALLFTEATLFAIGEAGQPPKPVAAATATFFKP